MKIDGKHYCDWCCVEFEKDTRTGFLYSANDRLKRAVRSLFGVLLCKDCDNAIVRKAAPKIPMNKKMLRYVRGVESGAINPPFRMSVKRGDKIDHLPIKLTANGEPAK